MRKAFTCLSEKCPLRTITQADDVYTNDSIHGVCFPTVKVYVYMYTLGAGRILIKSNITVCLWNLMAWKASWAHITGENEKKIMIK